VARFDNGDGQRADLGVPWHTMLTVFGHLLFSSEQVLTRYASKSGWKSSVR
jgi:hypothetical protein